MPPGDHNRLPYAPPLDGIRAIAIVAVLLFHISPAALKGGFSGVDVFFVLSGFLITSIILHDIHGECFSLREFYLRRIQRLLPNVIVTVLAVLLLWSYWMPPNASIQPGVHGLWTLFNLSNVYVWKYLGGYWGDTAASAPLTHFWSLGIEEQFYLFFPASLLLLTRLQPRRVALWLSVATVLSFGICLHGTHAHPVATFYLLPTRVWELLLGAVLAACRAAGKIQAAQLPRFLGAHVCGAVGWIGLGTIVVGYLMIDEGDGFPGWVSLTPTVGTACVLVSVSAGESRVSRFLSAPFMVGIGKLSYSLYLWHWPLIEFGKMQAGFYGWSQSAGAALGGLAGVVLGSCAYVGVERPLRKRGSGRSWRLVTIAAGFTVAVLSCWVVATRHIAVDPDHRFATPTFSGLLFDTSQGTEANMALAVRYSDVYFPVQPPQPPDIWRKGGVIHLYGNGHPQVVVLGSSHALMYSRLIDDICHELKLSVAFLSRNGTPALFENAAVGAFPSALEGQEFDETRKKWLQEWRPDAVFVIDRWDDKFGTQRGFAARLRAFLNEVCPLAGRVIFVAQVPVAEQGETVNLRWLITSRMGARNRLPRLAPDSNEPIRKQAVAAAESATADFPSLRVLRVDLPFYRDDGSVRYAEGRKFFYADDDHLTDIGTEEVRELFKKAIDEAHQGVLGR